MRTTRTAASATTTLAAEPTAAIPPVVAQKLESFVARRFNRQKRLAAPPDLRGLASRSILNGLWERAEAHYSRAAEVFYLRHEDRTGKQTWHGPFDAQDWHYHRDDLVTYPVPLRPL